MRKISLLWGFLLLFWLPIASAAEWTGSVVDVRDGDLLKINHPDKGAVTVMLYGIDAPDHGQPYFQEAKEFLAGKVEGQVVTVRELETEQNVITALVFHNGANINEQVLQAGYGWVYQKHCREEFCTEWLTYERVAREHKRGLWQEEDPMPPWEWRKKVLTKVFRVFLWILPPWSD